MSEHTGAGSPHYPYRVDTSRCTGCAGCRSGCPAEAISLENDTAVFTGQCTRCGACFRFCPVGAIVPQARREPCTTS